MHKRTKLIIGALTVVVALAAAIASASARRIEVSEQRFLVLFRELTFESGGTALAVCPVNLEGSFHSRTISKVNEQLVGYITEAVVHFPCRTGAATALPETLPWHIHYESFRGTLPNITEIILRVDNGGFKIAQAGQECLYEATATRMFGGAVNREAGGVARTLRVNENLGIPKRSGGILCPSEGRLRGTGTVGTQSSWTGITVRLVQ